MSSRIRFNDAGDVFAAFPELARYAPAPAGPVEALAYAGSLLDMRPPSAVLAYLSHLLPRREAVWWGCQSVAAVLGAAAQDEGLRLASAWVRNPDESARRAALDYAQAADLKVATAWLARAAGYSGGSLLAPDQASTLPPVDACAQSVNAAVIVATSGQAPQMILPWIRACAEAGVRFAAGEDAKVIAPPVSRTGSPAAALSAP